MGGTHRNKVIKTRKNGKQRAGRDNEPSVLGSASRGIPPLVILLTCPRGGGAFVRAYTFRCVDPKAGALYGFPQAELALP